MAEWKPIDDLFDFEKGTLQSSKCTSGKYTFVTAAEEWKTHESYTHDCEALIFAMAASGSLGRTHYIKGKFIASDLCFILTPKRGLQLDLTFYYRLFNFLRSDIVKKTATGTSKLAINQTNFGAYKLPYFDYDHQLIFRDKIEKINGISESFSLGLDDQLTLLKQLHQALMQEAIEGKLTAEWRRQNQKLISGENHASKLLEKIKAEKECLISEGKIKKDKPLAPTKPEEVPFALPDGWVWCRLGFCSINKDDARQPISQAERERKEKNYPYYGASGVIDKIDGYTHQGKNLLIGEDGANLVARATPIAFMADGKYWVNNHAHVIGFLDEITLRFVEIHINAIDLKSYITGGFQPKLSQGNLNLIHIAFPPLAEQKAIVERVEKLMAMIDELEEQITKRKNQSERLMQSVLREAFTQ